MAGSLLDMLKQMVQKAAPAAGNALLGGAPNNVGNTLDAASELAKLQRDGPPNSMQYGSWQARIDQLKKQLNQK